MRERLRQPSLVEPSLAEPSREENVGERERGEIDRDCSRAQTIKRPRSYGNYEMSASGAARREGEAVARLLILRFYETTNTTTTATTSTCPPPPILTTTTTTTTTTALVHVTLRLRLLLLYLSSASVEACGRVEVVPETDELGEELKLLDDGRISRHDQQQPVLRRPLALLLPGGRDQQLVQLGLNGGIPGVEPYERHLTVAACFQAVLPPPAAL